MVLRLARVELLTRVVGLTVYTQRRDFDATNVPAMYGSASSLLGLVKHAEEDAWLSLALMFHLSVLPLTRQLTCLSGSLWAKTLQGARAQRIEYLLLHEFHRLK